MNQKAFPRILIPNIRIIAPILTLLTAILLSGCATTKPPLKTVTKVDLGRYMGRWYVIANIPYSLERGKVASYDTYARQADGRMVNCSAVSCHAARASRRPGGAAVSSSVTWASIHC